MTGFEIISNSSDESYRVEFLEACLPPERSLEMERPDKGLEMELRNMENRKGWKHLLDSNDDSEYNFGTKSMWQGLDSLLGQLPMDLLPQEYLDHPQDPQCILDEIG